MNKGGPSRVLAAERASWLAANALPAMLIGIRRPLRVFLTSWNAARTVVAAQNVAKRSATPTVGNPGFEGLSIPAADWYARSWPCLSDKGPRGPQPDSSTYNTRGFALRHALQSMPNFFAVPGRNACTTMSAPARCF